MSAELGIGALSEEYRGAQLGDDRRSARLMRIAEQVERDPGASFPAMCATDGELEAIYRFLRNADVTPDGILEPHMHASARRCVGFETILAIHDSSEFSFSSPRKNVGRLQKARVGFLGHFALAVGCSVPGSALPLGLLALSTLHRLEPPKKQTRAQRRHAPNKESARWLTGVDHVRSRLADQTAQVLHVADRESDFYPMLAHLVAHGDRFVIRRRCNRNCRTDDGDVKAMDAVVANAPAVEMRNVHISERLPWKGSMTAQTRHAPRDARFATLHVRAARVEVMRPYHDKTPAERLTVNVVDVFEPQPPLDEEPIAWTLLTSQPIDTVEQQIAIVDIYRARWLIEEFFKAVKTGCDYEAKQLESKETLLNALAILLPAAWQLLAMRAVSRLSDDAPASTILTQPQIEVLRHLAKRVTLGPNPTARQALLAIAGVGGHIKNNGDPGWLVLHRGMSALQLATLGWAAARQQGNCDQS